MEKKILNVLRMVLENEAIGENCSQEICPMWDSLRHLNVCFTLENEFNVMFTPEEMMKMRSFNDIVLLLKTKGVE